VILWGGRILLRGEQLIQAALLGRGPPYRKRHARQRKARIDRPSIELGFGQRIQMARDNDSPVVVQYLGDPVALRKRGPDRE
jgi:hypothetical protein